MVKPDTPGNWRWTRLRWKFGWFGDVPDVAPVAPDPGPIGRLHDEGSWFVALLDDLGNGPGTISMVLNTDALSYVQVCQLRTSMRIVVHSLSGLALQ